MKSNYKEIGELIEKVDERNVDGSISTLVGVSIEKCFIKSVANTIGTDLTKYKVIRRNEFAVSLMQVSRDEKIPVARLADYDSAIMSPAYPIFKVKDANVILPEYLDMWFKRSEFDREASFIAVGGVRGSMPYEEFCRMKVLVPPIEKQRNIVKAYKTITDRIALKQRINDNLAVTEQIILRQITNFENTVPISLEEIVEFIDGDRGKNYPTYEEFFSSGYCLFLNASNVTGNGFDFSECMFVTEEKDKAMNKGHLQRFDIVLTSRGTLGNIALYDNYIPFENIRINSGMLIIRSKSSKIQTYYLYALLKSNYMKTAIEQYRSGSAQPQLPIKDLQKISFDIPISQRVIQKINSQFQKIEETISKNNNEINELRKMLIIILSQLSR